MRLPLPLLSLLLISPTFSLATRVFYAQSVSYCSAARAIQVQKFLLEYNADTNAISFDISAATTQENLDAALSFQLTAYGIDAVNQTINLCDTLSGVLCPLPTYDFVGSATIPLPSSLTSKINIPGIGYKIPDLEATAYVRLINVNTGLEAACLRVDLSNGLSMRYRGVSWALGGVALGMLLVGILGGLVSLWRRYGEGIELGRSKERLVAYILFLQFVATTGMLSLDYPNVMLAFTANFAWAMGLIFITPIQVGIDGMRNHTGGDLGQIAGNLVGGTAALSRRSEMEEAVRGDLWTIFERIVEGTSSTGKGLIKRATTTTSSLYDVPTVQQNDTLTAVAQGIPRYTTNIGISPYDAFMTTFVTFLLLLAVFLAVLIVVVPVFYCANRRAKKGDREVRLTRKVFWNLVRATALRIVLISWYPLLILSFYQWTIGRGDSWAAILLSVLTIVFTTGSFLFLAIRAILQVRRSHHIEFTREPLHAKLIASGAGASAPFWNGFKESRWWFFFPLLVATFIRACFVSFARSHGWRQSVGLVVVEALVFLSMCIFTPFADKSSNGTHITIQILKIIISGALIVFNESLHLNEIIRTAIGLVIAVIESVIVVGFFILLLIDAVKIFISIFRRRKNLMDEDLVMFDQHLAPPQMMERPRTSGSMTLADSEGSNHVPTGFKPTDQETNHLV